MLLPDQVQLELHLSEHDASRYDALFARLAASGIRFSTLAAAQREDSEWLERFTALDNATRGETGDPAVPRSVEQMRARLAGFELAPDACFIAFDAERWIGYTLLDPALSRDGRLEQSWTGVVPAYRRRGVATALKVLGAGYARAHGYAVVVTAPRRRNVASLGMSTKIGFRPSTTG